MSSSSCSGEPSGNDSIKPLNNTQPGSSSATLSIRPFCANCGHYTSGPTNVRISNHKCFTKPCVTSHLFRDVHDSLDLPVERISYSPKRIGSGWSGTVFRIRNGIAVKIAHATNLFLRELGIYLHVQTLPSSYALPIPKFHRVYLIEKSFGIGMDFIPGVPLSKISPILTSTEKTFLAKTTLKLLQKLHDNGICHGDIHSENLLFPKHRNGNGEWDFEQAVFIDLGVAKLKKFMRESEWEGWVEEDRTRLAYLLRKDGEIDREEIQGLLKGSGA